MSGAGGRVMEVDNVATTKADDEDSGRGSLNSGSQTVICIFIPKLDVKVTARPYKDNNGRPTCSEPET